MFVASLGPAAAAGPVVASAWPAAVEWLPTAVATFLEVVSAYPGVEALLEPF